jgi:hypothetical protein
MSSKFFTKSDFDLNTGGKCSWSEKYLLDNYSAEKSDDCVILQEL